MARRGQGRNFPHHFEICPKCGKRGLYSRNSTELRVEEACRYCPYHSEIDSKRYWELKGTL